VAERVRLISPVVLCGVAAQAGTLVTLDETEAAQLVSRGLAIYASREAEISERPAERAVITVRRGGRNV
jgi:hypothetical protein